MHFYISFAFDNTISRDGQYFKYMYLKYVFEIQNTILYLNTLFLVFVYFQNT